MVTRIICSACGKVFERVGVVTEGGRCTCPYCFSTGAFNYQPNENTDGVMSSEGNGL